MPDMPKPRARVGSIVLGSEPNWEPLLAAVGEPHSGPFTWMYETHLRDGTRIHAYKHSWTRRYLFLSEDGRCFENTQTGKYRQTDLGDVLFWTLPHRSEWLRYGGYDPEDEWAGSPRAAGVLIDEAEEALWPLASDGRVEEAMWPTSDEVIPLGDDLPWPPFETGPPAATDGQDDDAAADPRDRGA